MTNIILTGFSGSGKSAVGRAAAALLGWAFVDVDAEVVRRAGKPVSAVFAEHGEAAFRRLEAEALADACSRGPAVVATGGGAIADPANRDLMLRSGVVVSLEARSDTIVDRLAADGAEVRPLLHGPSPRDRIERAEGGAPARLCPRALDGPHRRPHRRRRRPARSYAPGTSSAPRADGRRPRRRHPGGGRPLLRGRVPHLRRLGPPRRAGAAVPPRRPHHHRLPHLRRDRLPTLRTARTGRVGGGGHPHPHADPPGRRDLQDPGAGRRLPRLARRAACRAAQLHRRPRRRRHWRPRGLRRCHLQPGHALRPGPHVPRRHGRRLHRRQDRRRPAPGQEPRRRLPPAPPHPRRARHPHHPLPPRDGRRLGRGHQARPHPRRRPPPHLRRARRSHPGPGDAAWPPTSFAAAPPSRPTSSPRTSGRPSACVRS